MSILLGARSQKNSYLRHNIGLYLYSNGSKRQVFSVLSHFGLSSSYTSLAGHGEQRSTQDLPFDSANSNPTTEAASQDSEIDQCVPDTAGSNLSSDSQKSSSDQDDVSDIASPLARGQSSRDMGREEVKERPTKHKPHAPSRGGLLKRISQACRAFTRKVQRATGLLSFIYDNINLRFNVAEECLGRKDTQENGTCATAFALFDTEKSDLKTSDLLTSIDNAPPLKPEDILLTPHENKVLLTHIRHTALRIIVKHGGELFHRFASDVNRTLPVVDKIPLHKTNLYPLPALPIDESSTLGNAQVVRAIFEEAGIDPDSADAQEIIKILWGDQLSVARLRSVSSTRVGHDSPSNALLDSVYGPGMFHYQIAHTGSILETHFGNPHLYTRNPGSLCFHNTVLDRKPIVLTSPPPYRTCRDLISVSLYARVLHCLELVVGKDLNEYGKTVTFEQLVQDVSTLVDKYTDVLSVQDHREARTDHSNKQTTNSEHGQEPLTVGDMVYENAILFMRDGLVMREFIDAIKVGDSGRMILVLKVLALAYRGAGRTKYAHEMLHLIHNLTSVWPKSLR